MTEANTSHAPLGVIDPSSAVGEIKKSPEQIQEQVLDLLAMTDDKEFVEESKRFIDERITSLEAEAEPVEISSFRNNIHAGFVHSETAIHNLSSEEGGRFKLDDADVYATLLTSMREIVARPGWERREMNDQGFRLLVLRGVNEAQATYFGNYIPDAAGQLEHAVMARVGEDIDETPAEYSVADFKGKAMCVERAATTNNMLAFLGVETNLVTGKLDFVDGSELHAFVILKKASGGDMLYDPMRPFITHNTDKGTHAASPALYSDVESILAGGSVTVANKFTTVTNGEKVVQETPLTYHASIYAGTGLEPA